MCAIRELLSRKFVRARQSLLLYHQRYSSGASHIHTHMPTRLLDLAHARFEIPSPKRYLELFFPFFCFSMCS